MAQSTTRLCIKGLPASVNDNGLRKFLQERLPDATLTDCRVLQNAKGRSRRMAFLGFGSAPQAQQAVEQLHQTYCQSSKLIVEYALLPKQRGGGEKSKTSKEQISRDTKKDEETRKKEKRKQEFLDILNTSKGTKKIWANDDDDENKNEPELQEEESDDDEEEEPAQPSTEPPKSDLDFLKSKQVETTDLEKDKTTLAAAEDDAKQAENDDKNDSIVLNRLFLRNLPFTTTEDDIQAAFSPFGTILDCHLPVDDQHRPKGFGFVTLTKPHEAQAALQALDGSDFHGRLLHILPARRAPSSQKDNDDDDDDALEHGKGTYKQQREEERRQQAMRTTMGWASSFVRGDAVVDTVASRLGVSAGQVLAVQEGLSAGDAAVRMALAETAIVEENAKYFQEHGYSLDSIVSEKANHQQDIPRSQTALLVKNLPHDTQREELAKTFSKTGADPVDILLSPSKTLAVIVYASHNDAKSVFRRLAYRRFKAVPLYLEWAPLTAKGEKKKAEGEQQEEEDSPQQEEPVVDVEEEAATSTLYVKNLNFKTTEEELREFFTKGCKGVRSARIPTKSAAVKRGETEETVALSMGFGFVEFESLEAAQAGLQQLNGQILQGHTLELKLSQARSTSSRVPKVASGKAPTKLMVKNVAFQANRQELLKLFGAFGHLKKLRLPKKFDGTNRGFAFVEYSSHKDATEALKALAHTHLYGRHLVLEWAASDEESNNIDNLREKAQRNVQGAPPNKKIKFRY